MAGPITGTGNCRGTWRQPSSWGRNESGNFSQVIFEGTKAEVTILAASFAQTDGLAYEVAESFGKFRLQVQVPWNFDGLVDPRTDTLVRWELFSEHAEKHLLEAQVNTGSVAKLSLLQKDIIRAKYQNPPDASQGQPAAKQSDFADPANALDANGAYAFDIYQVMVAGGVGYPMEAPRLRRTLITSNQYALGYALVNIKKILTTGYIIANESLEPNLIFNLSAYTAADVSTDFRLTYGWYKPFPTINNIALLKWQIVQEWHYGWWPIATFGNPIPA